MRDQHLERISDGGTRIATGRHLQVLDLHPFRIDSESHLRQQLVTVIVVLQMRFLDLADLVTRQLDADAGLYATLIALEIGNIDDLGSTWHTQRMLPVVIEPETRAFLTRPRGQNGQRSLECDTSRQELLPRAGPDPDALRTRCQVDAPGVPEPRLRVHEIIPWRADERGYGYVGAVRRKRVTLHLTDRDTVVRNRRASCERAEIRCFQCERTARRVGRENRRLIERHEIALRIAILARVHLDVATRHDGGKPGDSADADVRGDDVKTGLFIQI